VVTCIWYAASQESEEAKVALERSDQMIPVPGCLISEDVRRVVSPLEAGFVRGDENPEVVQRMLLVAGATPSSAANVERRPAVQPEVGAKQTIGPPS
jgi:hypothetical protein